MAGASTPAHPVYCETGELYVALQCDNLCPDCSARMYLMEKRYAVTNRVRAAGRPVRDLEPSTAYEVGLWAQWRTDRERFRSIGVDGGEGGELGQGWQKQKFVVLGKDFYREAGKAWMSDRYGPGRMLGWKEDLGFDGFLGEMGSFERPNPSKGMTVNEVYGGVGDQEEISGENSKEEPKI